MPLNDDFIGAISGVNKLLDYTELVFNPLEINNEDKNNPNDEIDPDSYFYGLQQNIGQMCNSNYYTDDMFSELVGENGKYDKYVSMMHCNIRSL